MRTRKPAETGTPSIDAAVATTSRIGGAWLRWRIRLALWRERRLVRALAASLQSGFISHRRAAALRGGTIDDLDDLFATHGIEHVSGL